MPLTNFPHGVTSFGIPQYGQGFPLGVGAGQVYYTVTEKSATNYFYVQLTKNGIPGNRIFLTLAAAYAATTSGQNDVIVATPGTYTETATTTWANDNTHLVGVGGPQSRGNMGNSVCFNTTTITLASVVEVTGDNCCFYNVQLRNAGANAACLSALKVSDGENFYAEGCHFVGHAAATQVGTANTCSLWLYTASTGKPWGATFVNCKIGDAGERVRTDGYPIYISGTAGGTAKYVTFDNCVIEGWCETAAKPSVYFAANYCIDRYILFKDCFFFNYWVNQADTQGEVIGNACGTTFYCVLMGSTCNAGFTAWNTTGLAYIHACGPAAGATMGTAVAAT